MGYQKYTKEDLAYIAGFIDGEGWIGVSRIRRRMTSRPSYSPKIRVANTKFDVLNWMRKKLRYGYIFRNRALSKPNFVPKHKLKDQFYWTMSSRGILDVGPLLIPYLHLKKRQLKILMQIARINLLSQESRPRNGNSSFIEDRLARLWAELRELNK